MFKDEFNDNLDFDVPGRLAMANSGPDTNGSQFFITEVPIEYLNHKHTIFGQCDDASINVVKSIARVQRDPNDKPITDVVLAKVTIVPVGQPLPPAQCRIRPIIVTAESIEQQESNGLPRTHELAINSRRSTRMEH